MKVVVTGGTGFIGHHLVEAFRKRGESVAVIARDAQRATTLWESGSVILHQADLGARGVELKAALDGADTVFHLAGYAHAVDTNEATAEAIHRRVTLEGTRTLLSEAGAVGVKRIVFLSSVKAMGEKSVGCLDESAECRPTTAYGRSKLAAEKLVFDCGWRTGMHMICLRLPLVYGPGNKGNLFSMLSAIDRGRFPPVSNIKNRRSMVHVANVVDAALLAATHPAAAGQTYIVTDARPYSTGEIYQLISRALGLRIPSWSVPTGFLKAVASMGDTIGRIRGKRWLFDSDALSKLTGDAWYSSAKITRELGYQPKVTFEEALPELISWYRGTRAQPTC